MKHQSTIDALRQQNTADTNFLDRLRRDRDDAQNRFTWEQDRIIPLVTDRADTIAVLLSDQAKLRG